MREVTEFLLYVTRFVLWLLYLTWIGALSLSIIRIDEKPSGSGVSSMSVVLGLLVAIFFVHLLCEELKSGDIFGELGGETARSKDGGAVLSATPIFHRSDGGSDGHGGDDLAKPSERVNPPKPKGKKRGK